MITPERINEIQNLSRTEDVHKALHELLTEVKKLYSVKVQCCECGDDFDLVEMVIQDGRFYPSVYCQECFEERDA